MPKSTGIKMPPKLRDLLSEIDCIKLDSTHPRQAFSDTGIQLFDKSGNPIRFPRDIEPLLASLVQWILNQPTNRLKKSERDDLRKRLDAYGMKVHQLKKNPRRRRWIITQKNPLLPDPWSSVVTWNGKPKEFWRLQRVAEFLKEVERLNPFATTAARAEEEK